MGNTEHRTEQKQVENHNENNSEYTHKIGTIGNFLLAMLIILIAGTGALTYYLIHSEKENYDNQKNKIVSDNLTEEPDTIANIIDSAIANVTASSTTEITSTEDNDAKKIMNEKLIVLYNGMVLDVSKMDEVALQYIDAHSDEKDKYVITYSSYENYSFKDSKLGILSETSYDGLLKIEQVGKIAISEDYNAIPRNIKVVNTIPAIILENNDKFAEYDTVKSLIIDLDGNGTNEYILVLANKTTGFSKITLVDSKGEKIADLASIEKSKWNKTTNTEYYLSIHNIEILDVDNDGIMEIMIEIPNSTGNPTISLLKYKNGELQGKTGIECSLVTE